MGDVGLDDLVIRGKKMKAEVAGAIQASAIERTMGGSSSISLALRDADRDLLRSDIFSSRADLRFDSLLFELSSISKSGDDLSVRFEAAGVADLRKKKGRAIFAAAGTSTRTKFAKRLVSDVKWLQFRGEEGIANLVRLARSKKEDSWECIQRLAGERDWRCFENEGVIWFGSDDWLAKQSDVTEVSEDDDGIDYIDFSYNKGKRAESATIQCYAKRWASRPGAPVRMRRMSQLCRGLWIVESVGRSITSAQCRVSLTRKTNDLPEPKPDAASPSGGWVDGPGSTTPGGKRSSTGWQWPTSGTVSPGGEFGVPRTGHTHAGIDIGAPTGTPIRPGKPGVVTAAGYIDPKGYGNAVYIDHGGGFTSRSGHLSEVSCRTGQEVGYDTLVGKVGETGNAEGPHLHWEIWRNGSPVDPRGYLP